MKTHADMSKQATNISSLGKDSNLLENLGLEGSLTSNQLAFPDSEGKPSKIMELIGFGARNEDLETKSRPLNHFYDPVNDRGLTYGVGIGMKTFEWAMEDPKKFKVIAGTLREPPPPQHYSFPDANDYLFKVITSPEKAEREKNFGLLFQTLGHLLHLIQDMAQPEHVRNDPHLSLNGNDINDIPSEWFNIEDVSSYEIYTRDKRDLPLTGYPAVELPRATDFWHEEALIGYGLADYTNRNFVSKDTNFDDDTFPRPSGALGDSVDIQTLFAEIEEPVPMIEGKALKGEITFIKNIVVDYYPPNTTSSDNERAASLSIFDADLKKYNVETICIEDPYDDEDCEREYKATQDLYTLNRFNFDAAHKFLIPHAVGYSAGFLNYFFRGKLEISPPDEGVYAVVDHATVNKINEGFTRLKLKLKNVTPPIQGDGQQMWAGSKGNEIFVVAKYHRNPCYRPDLTGEYKAGKFFIPQRWNGCTAVDPQEYIAVSRPTENIGLGSEPGRDFTFEFDTPIPLNAIDLVIQVVYRGKLGKDEAVIVATQDISEPTFVSITNLSNHLAIENTMYAFTEIMKTERLKQIILQEMPWWDGDLYLFDFTDFCLKTGPQEHTLVTAIEPLVAGDYIRLALFLKSEEPTASSFHTNGETWRHSTNNKIIKTRKVLYDTVFPSLPISAYHHLGRGMPNVAVTKMNNIYHLYNFKLFFANFRHDPYKIWDYSRIAPPPSGRLTPVPVAVNF